MDYWEECLAEAFEDAGIAYTQEQLSCVTSWIEGAHDNYSLATGLDIINRNWESPEAIELRELKKDLEKHHDWLHSTYPCKSCNTTGTVEDTWGRTVGCNTCDGKGRTRWKQ